MQPDEITKQLTAFATKYGYNLKVCASPSHWQLTMRNCKFNVHYGRKGFCVVEAHGLCNIRTATLRELAGHILAITLQQGGDNQNETKTTTVAAGTTATELQDSSITVVQDTVSRLVAIYVDGRLLRVEPYLTTYSCEPRMAITMQTSLARYAAFPKQLCDVKPLCAVEFPKVGTEPTPEKAAEPAKPSSREWAAAFVEKSNRFPHAIDYADAGYGTGSQCDCTTVGECVLHAACNGHHCDRNCYTQQLQDYIVMSNTKRAPSKVEERPATVEALLAKIRTMMTDADCDTICIPLWAEKLLLQGAHLGDVRRTMRWQAGSWRPQSIYSLRCIWETKDLVVE